MRHALCLAAILGLGVTPLAAQPQRTQAPEGPKQAAPQPVRPSAATPDKGQAGRPDAKLAPRRVRGWLDPLRYRDLAAAAVNRLRRVEFVAMLSAVHRLPQMGPGEGWFRPSQSRYGWAWLAARYGIDPKGKIGRKEFKGPAEVFDRLDRSRDGTLGADDFDWSDRSPFARAAMPSSMWFRTIDANSNGRISREEWEALFARMSKGRGYVILEDLREAFPTMPPPRPPGPPPKNEGPSMFTLVVGLFTGELGSPWPGPSVGQVAPDFTLPLHDGKGAITLSHYRGKKPVVLIFGSFT